MKKSTTFLLAALIIGVWSFSAVQVQAQSQVVSQESITSFQSTITVNTDNSVGVVESILYNTGPSDRHGIYRDIYPFSSEGRPMDIRDIKVVDENGVPYQWQRQTSSGNIRLKIGDPNVTFLGEKRYVISYTATDAVAHPKDVDEIYWNVTGNEWLIPIYGVEATVVFPPQIQPVRSACYYGPKGNTSRCELVQTGQYKFISPALKAGEGMTVAVGFPKGVIPPYATDVDEPFVPTPANPIYVYISWFLAFLLPLLVFIVMFMRWRKHGRDPKGTGVIVPQYDVLDGLTPLEVACILHQKISSKDISAELVYLATQGYLKIRQIEHKTLGIFKSTDYEFVLQKDISGLPDKFDRTLLEAIFASPEVGETRMLSDLKDEFYAKIPVISGDVVDVMLAKGYYSNLKKGSFTARTAGIAVTAIVAFWVAIVAGRAFIVQVASRLLEANPIFMLELGASVIVSVIIFVVIDRLMPAKTEKGVAAKEHILGLKEYLRIAEKDRLEFHNAPEKKPEVFEKLLPYAMVLGVNDVWAKEFEGIYTTPPSWYEGSNSAVFNAVYFNHTLSSFNAMAASSMASNPSSGGSGGGGFSGGGGGGGGGGGW